MSRPPRDPDKETVPGKPAYYTRALVRYLKTEEHVTEAYAYAYAEQAAPKLTRYDKANQTDRQRAERQRALQARWHAVQAHATAADALNEASARWQKEAPLAYARHQG